MGQPCCERGFCQRGKREDLSTHLPSEAGLGVDSSLLLSSPFSAPGEAKQRCQKAWGFHVDSREDSFRRLAWGGSLSVYSQGGYEQTDSTNTAEQTQTVMLQLRQLQ